MEQKDHTAAQRLDALVEKGRQAGALTIGDLLTLEELDLSLEETERFYDRIERLNIDIAFEEPPAQASDAAADMTDPGCLLRVLSMYESPEVNRIIRVYRQFRHTLGRDPSAEEIAAELHMPVGKVRSLIARAGAGRLGNGCVRAGAPAVKPPAPLPRNGRENNYEQSINNIGKALDFPGGGV